MDNPVSAAPGLSRSGIIPFLDLGAVNAAHGDEIAAAVARATGSGRYILGEEDRRFEEAYAGFIGTRHAVGVANGLDALWLILRALIETGRLHTGDEVLVPADTFIATVLAITENGLRARLVDPDPVTMQLTAGGIRDAVTPRTRAVMLVHLYGLCAYTDAVGDVCRDNNLILLEDAAQAHGARYRGRRAGSFGLAAAHSFYPGKNLGCLGDGGAVTTDDATLADTVRALANYGSARKYVFRYCGRNSRLDEIQAAVLAAKLPHLDADNDRRRAIADIYFDRINNPAVTLPCRGEPEQNVFHIFPLRTGRRDRLQQYLADNGVQTLIHYPVPPHRQECYSRWRNLSLPVAERIADTELSLPISPVISPEQAARVADLVNSFV